MNEYVVIPAQAGMILSSRFMLLVIGGYPCTSGDDPGHGCAT